MLHGVGSRPGGGRLCLHDHGCREESERERRKKGMRRHTQECEGRAWKWPASGGFPVHEDIVEEPPMFSNRCARSVLLIAAVWGCGADRAPATAPMPDPRPVVLLE